MSKDDADIASEQEEYQRLEAFYRVVHHNCLPKGSCLNCSEPTSASFCDVGCREDYERRQQLQRKTKAHHD